jgi:pilus assembly protein Flp/PilA
MARRQKDAGQGLVEYAFILVLVVLIVIVVIVLLGPAVGDMYSNIMFNI